MSFREYVEERTGKKFEEVSEESKLKWRELFDKHFATSSQGKIGLRVMYSTYCM